MEGIERGGVEVRDKGTPFPFTFRFFLSLSIPFLRLLHRMGGTTRYLVGLNVI